MYLLLIIMDKKIIFKFIVKVLLYAITLIASYFGVSSLTSCTVQRSSESIGRARIIIVDTTDVVHNGNSYFRPVRRR